MEIVGIDRSDYIKCDNAAGGKSPLGLVLALLACKTLQTAAP